MAILQMGIKRVLVLFSAKSQPRTIVVLEALASIGEIYRPILAMLQESGEDGGLPMGEVKFDTAGFTFEY